MSTWIPGLLHKKPPTFASKKPGVGYVAAGRFLLGLSASNGKIVERHDAGAEIVALCGLDGFKLAAATKDGKLRIFDVSVNTVTSVASGRCSVRFPVLATTDALGSEEDGTGCVAQLVHLEGSGADGIFGGAAPSSSTNSEVVAVCGDSATGKMKLVSLDPVTLEIRQAVAVPRVGKMMGSRGNGGLLLTASANFVAIVLTNTTRTDGGSSKAAKYVFIRDRKNQNLAANSWTCWSHHRRITAISIDPSEQHLAIGDSRGMVFTCFAPFRAGALVSGSGRAPGAAATKKLKMTTLRSSSESKNEAAVAPQRRDEGNGDVDESSSDESSFLPDEPEDVVESDGDAGQLLASATSLSTGAGLHHWHSGAVASLGHLSGQEIYSGSHESVLVIRNLEMDTKKFFPRLGGPIVWLRPSPDFVHMAASMADNSVAFVNLHQANKVTRVRGVHAPFAEHRSKHRAFLSSSSPAHHDQLPVQLQMVPPTPGQQLPQLAVHSGRNHVQFFSVLDGANNSESCSTGMQPVSSVAVQARNGQTGTDTLLEAGEIDPETGKVRYNQSKRVNNERPWMVTHFRVFEGLARSCLWMVTVEQRLEDHSSSESTLKGIGRGGTSSSRHTTTNLRAGALLKFWKKSSVLAAKNGPNGGVPAPQWELDSSVYDAHRGEVTSLLAYVDVDSDASGGPFVLTTGCDGLLKKWQYARVGSGNEPGNSFQSKFVWQTTQTASWKDDAPLHAAALSVDGSVLALSSGSALLLWDAESFTQLLEPVEDGEQGEEAQKQMNTNTKPVLDQNGRRRNIDSVDCVTMEVADEVEDAVVDGDGDGAEEAHGTRSRSSRLETQMRQLEFGVWRGKFCLFALGYGKLNIWDLATQTVFFRVELKCESPIVEFVWLQKSGTLLLRGEREIKVLHSNSTGGFDLREHPIKSSASILGMEWCAAAQKLLVLGSDCEVTTHTTDTGESGATAADDAQDLLDGHLLAAPATPANRKGTSTTRSPPATPCHLHHFSRLFAGQQSSAETNTKRPDAFEAALKVCTVEGRSCQYVANRHFVEQIVDPHTPSHVLPGAEHLFKRLVWITQMATERQVLAEDEKRSNLLQQALGRGKNMGEKGRTGRAEAARRAAMETEDMSGGAAEVLPAEFFGKLKI